MALNAIKTHKNIELQFMCVVHRLIDSIGSDDSLASRQCHLFLSPRNQRSDINAK